MLLNQSYTHSPEIQTLLNTLEGQKTAFNLIPIHPDFSLNLRRHSLLGSARYSARIEGIEGDTEQNVLARQNLERTYAWLYQQKQVLSLNPEFIKTLHAKSHADLTGDAGQFRVEQSAIFNSAGVAIYLTPPPQEIKSLLLDWEQQIAKSTSHPVIQAIISHYQFEKIHPFIDGNGRVGRLVLTQMLRSHEYDFGGLLVLEELIDQTRDDYYYHLQNEGKDLTQLIIYFLRLITQAAQQALVKITTPQAHARSTNLLPRRQELLDTISDHSPCSFDFLHRRFMAIPPSTLRFDLLQLQKNGLIHKLGVTRGTLYSASPVE